MPWSVSEEKDNRCPPEKPWAVIQDDTGEAVQCHISKEAAQTAVGALYTLVGDETKGDVATMHKMMVAAEYKALTAEDVTPGTFSAVVAAYGNVDKVGDRIIEGAFDESLAQWQKKGEPVPIILAHDWNNPFAHIGYVMPDKFKSVPGVGLVVEEGHLDIEDNPTAAQVYRLMERKQLAQFSFGYTIPSGGMTKAMDGAFDLTRLNLVEVGPCLRGINDQTQLLSIKAQLEANDRELTVEERVSRLEAELVGRKATDGPPVEPYDPQSAVKSMLVTGRSFMEKVNEAPAAEAMGEVVTLLQAVPNASPKPEFAGTKAETPEMVAATPTAGYDSVRVINSMIAQGQEFITNEEDAVDIATMEGVIATLQALATKEAAESALIGAPVDEATKTDLEIKTPEEPEFDAKSLDPEDIERRIGTIALEARLRNEELELNDVLEGGKADGTIQRLEDVESDLRKDSEG